MKSSSFFLKSYTVSEHSYSQSLPPAHRWTKRARKFQGGHSALQLGQYLLFLPLNTSKGCVSFLPFNAASMTEILNKVCWYLQDIQNFISWATVDCCFNYLHRKAWLQCRPVVCKPQFCLYCGCFPASAAEGGRRVCCKLRVNSRLFSINHSSSSLSSYIK